MVNKKFPFFAVAVCLLAAQTSSAQEKAIQADKVVDSIGVNTHLAYTNTSYNQQYSRVIAALQSAGIRHIRDGYYLWPVGNRMYTIHKAVAAAGIRTNYVICFCAKTETTVSDLETFKPLAGDMESLEAPNEFDVTGGPQWASKLRTYLPTLQQAGSALHVPVLGPALVNPGSYTQVGNIGQYMTANSLHIYFGGRNPGTPGWGSANLAGDAYGSIPWWLYNANVDAPGRPSYVTESGYRQTTASSSSTPYVVPQTVAGVYTVQTVFEMMTHGITRSYLYELMDDPTSPDLGIMTSNFAPKAPYNAIKALTSYLGDPGASFTPGSLQYTLGGSTGNVHHLLMQKRDGSFYLALWLNTPIYNPANNTSINVPSQQVTLTLDAAHGVQSYSTISASGSLTTKTQNLQYALSLPVSPSVTLVKIVAN